MRNEQLNIITERVDDFILLLHVMMRMELPSIIDRVIPRHHKQEGLSWGWVATIWLSHIISQGDHRKLTVRDWVSQAYNTLKEVTGLEIRDTDFTDDRLTIVLRELSKPKYWQAIEQELNQSMIRVYKLETNQVRVDATTVSGYHEGGEDSLFQFGYSKDNPAIRQVKVMMGALDPFGLPLTTDVVSGEKADNTLYIPNIERILNSLTDRIGLLIVGDCKLSALSTRAFIESQDCYYLSPLSMVGNTGKEMGEWVQKAIQGEQPLQEIEIVNSDNAKHKVKGYEFTRQCICELNDKKLEWDERILVVQSDTYTEAQIRGLEKRIATAKEKILALTPESGRGKTQITNEEELNQAIQSILVKHRVEGLIDCAYEKQIEIKTSYVGRGRGSKNREQKTSEKVRYQIIFVATNTTAFTELIQTYGWRAYATNAPNERLTMEAAILAYRNEWRIERDFHRLKGAPLSLDPMYVKRDDQAAGLIHLLSIAVRILTLIEFVVRRGLKNQNTTLIGLHKENPKKENANPTTERLLQAFSNIYLTIIHLPDRAMRHLTPLSDLQVKILNLLDLSVDVYLSLIDNSD